jgi:uncharacterized protein YceH (UPF0502 family)
VSSSASDVSSHTAPFAELEQLVQHLGDELSGFRRRALAAEGRLKTLEAEREQREARIAAEAAESAAAAAAERAKPVDDVSFVHPRVAELERENAELHRRLEQATARTRQVLDRVRFLRQQQANGGER